MANPFDQFDAPAATKSNPFDAFDAPEIDFNRPVEAVRADIAKLQGPERQQALAQWADTFVANERAQSKEPRQAPTIEPPTIGYGKLARQRPDQTADPIAAADAGRGIARGSFVGPWLDELTAATHAAQHAVGLGGAPYDESLAYQRARDKAYDEANPIASNAMKVAGGVAGGIGAARQGGVTAAGLLAGGPFAAAAPAQSLLGNMAKGAGIGTIYGANAGAGNAEGDLANLAEGALEGGATGAAVGGLLPPVVAGASKLAGAVSDFASPTLARWGQNIRNGMPQAATAEPGIASAGAASVPPMPRPPMHPSGADAAAEQMLANQLSRANVSTTDVRQRMATMPNVTGLVDVDPSLTRLGGSVARGQPEAWNRANSFIHGRQTGITPQEGMPNGAGIPTRQLMSPADPNARPMGQGERVRSVLREALDIPRGSAYRNERAVIEAQRTASRPAYEAMENASKGINMEPVVRPLISKWRDELIDQVDSVLRGRFNASISTVERALAPGGKASQFERLDKAKQAIDEWIGKAKQSADKRSPTLARLLTNMKNELVDAMDGVQTNNVGTLYKQARDVFGDAAQMRKAIELGRGALRQESEFTADQYAKLTPAEQRMFRTGLFGDIEKSIATSKRGADITQIFDSPRAQEILETVIGRGGAVPPGPLGETMARMNAQRPERIGQMIQGEKQFIGTRNKVLGGSPTAERLGDDSNFKAMAGIVEQLRSAKSVSDVAVKATTAAINQIFGFRADMSAALARKLFTADRAELERILMGVEERMGPNRAAQFRNLMEQNAAQLMQGTANVAGAQRGDGRGPRPPSRPPGPP